MKGEFVVREVISDPRRYGKTLRVKQVEEAFRRDGVYTVQYVVHEDTYKPLRGVSVEAEPLPMGGPANVAERLSRAAVGWAPTFPRDKTAPSAYQGEVDSMGDGPLTVKAMQRYLTRKGAYGSTIKNREA